MPRREVCVTIALRYASKRRTAGYFAPRTQSAMVFQSGSSLVGNWWPPLWNSSPPASGARGCFRKCGY